MANYTQKANFLLSFFHKEERQRVRGFLKTLLRGGKLHAKSRRFLSRRYNKSKIEKTELRSDASYCYFVKGVYAPIQVSQGLDWEAHAGGKQQQEDIWRQGVDKLIEWLEASQIPAGIVKLTSKKNLRTVFEIGLEETQCDTKVLLRGREYADASRRLEVILEGLGWRF